MVVSCKHYEHLWIFYYDAMMFEKFKVVFFQQYKLYVLMQATSILKNLSLLMNFSHTIILSKIFRILEFFLKVCEQQINFDRTPTTFRKKSSVEMRLIFRLYFEHILYSLIKIVLPIGTKRILYLTPNRISNF